MTEPKVRHRFRKILIANRGEIARRIARTVRELGMTSVAVFSDADENAPHVREADEAVRIGPAPSAQSYLDIDRILAAARAVGADAIHPGYGFLSERAEFAQRCIDAGFVFIGPSPDAIARMGSKIESKRIAAQAGVPVIEGFSVQGLMPDAIVERASALGYPVLIKASAGGGGRGMRIVRAASEMSEALASAEREALAAFGDGTLLVERYLDSPRHIEIQIFGDHYGHAIHLFERECSIQRRHQKVIEEAPSPALDADLRARMGAAAVALAHAIGYSGAGTVELMLERPGGELRRDSAANQPAFYFLEVNTRLQVEHPVTEAITGLDLVRMQIEVAQGAPLTLEQSDLVPQGHAIEARLYAEDAARDFLPVTGRVALLALPALQGLRIDSGIEAGSEVSVHYDPMLAKVIAHGATREDARNTLAQGLRALAVGGLTTNREFLLDVLEHPAFVAGDTHTHFIDRHFPAAARAQRPHAATHPNAHVYAIAATLFLHEQRRAQPSPLPPSVPSGFRNNRWRKQEQLFLLDDQSVAVRYSSRANGAFEVETQGFAGSASDKVEKGEKGTVLHGEKGTVLHNCIVLHAPPKAPTNDAQPPPNTTMQLCRTVPFLLEVDGVRRRFGVVVEGERVIVHAGELCIELGCVPRFPAKLGAQVAGGCVAPMTGIVRKLAVAVGDRVAQGDLLLMLEAMKMEHRLLAQVAGVVKEVRVREGQMVDPDDVLVVVEALAD